MLFTSTVKVILASVKSGLSVTRFPSNLRKLPSISETIMCVTVNFTLECTTSTFQVTGCDMLKVPVRKMAAIKNSSFFIRFLIVVQIYVYTTNVETNHYFLT